jgi:hypothetical protein
MGEGPRIGKSDPQPPMGLFPVPSGRSSQQDQHQPAEPGPRPTSRTSTDIVIAAAAATAIVTAIGTDTDAALRNRPSTLPESVVPSCPKTVIPPTPS